TATQLVDAFEGDLDAEIERHLANRIAEVLEREVLVAAGVDDENEPASAAHHLVEPEVLEVAAVRQVDVRLRIRREAERLGKQRPDGESGALPAAGLSAFPAWVAPPPSEPNVEQ